MHKEKKTNKPKLKLDLRKGNIYLLHFPGSLQ